MQCVIFTLHDYFNFKMIKITYIDPARLFGASCTIILISKTDNPTRLFHTVQLFGTLEYVPMAIAHVQKVY